MADIMDVYNAKKKQTEVCRCKSCGSNLVYLPQESLLGCLRCGSKTKFKKDMNIEPMDFETQSRSGSDWTGTVVYRCENCGAKEIISEFEIVKNCPFCGTSNIVVSDELPGIKPNAIIPFKIDAGQAKSYFKDWVEEGFFISKQLKKSIESANINGVYSPCYTFTTDTKSFYSGELGEYVGSGKYSYTKWFRINGNIDYSFRDILIECGPKLTQEEVEELKPFAFFPYKYDKRFLSGFAASNYDITVDDSFEEAKDVMEVRLGERILMGYDFTEIEYLNIDTAYSNTKFSYLLLPVYICNYKYKNKVYNFFVNGLNGKVVGKKPSSAGKIAAIILGGLAVLAGIAAAIIFL